MADAVKKKKRKKKLRTAPWRQTKRALLILFFLTIAAAVMPVWRVVRAQGKTAESPKNAAVNSVSQAKSTDTVTPLPDRADKGAESVPVLP